MEKLVIDGGPCSGKTTGLAILAEKLLEKGIIPIIVPEAATLLIQSGIDSKMMKGISFQSCLLKLQLNNEEYWDNISSVLADVHDKRVVLLCDRGLLTGSAYVDLPQEKNNQLEFFQHKILHNFDLNVEKIRSEYLGIIHMVTAADGALDYYTLENNSARTETPEEAILLDQRTQKAWLGHSHLAVVSNSDKLGNSINFEQKINRVIEETFRILGIPVPIELEDKFKLKSFNPEKLPVPYEKIDITQTYLIPKNHEGEERIRERNWNGYSSYFHTIKNPGPDGGRFEIERLISFEQYKELEKRYYPESTVIIKTRYCFVWNSQYFEVDVFDSPSNGLILMEREKTDKNDTTELPNFIDIEKDVTHSGEYSNFKISMANC